MGLTAPDRTREQYHQVLDRLDRTQVRPVVVASHPRSGTHLLMDTLRLNFPACQSWKFWGERFDRLYLNLDLATEGPDLIGPRTIGRILTRARRPLVKTHVLPIFNRFAGGPVGCPLDPAFSRWLRTRAAFLYAYRDGRDVMMSLHEFMKGYDPRAHVPISEFIRQTERGVSRPRMWAAHVRNWCGGPSVYCVRMEEVLDNTDVVLDGIAERLELPFHPPGRVPAKTKNVAWNRWNRLVQMRPQSTAIISGLSDGPPANWRDAFSPADREFFREEVGTLLQTLGYEESDDWVGAPAEAGELAACG